MRFFGIFCQKGGILSEKNENFSEFFAKRGGGLGQSEKSLSEKSGVSKLRGGGGGVSGFRNIVIKYQFFLFDASPKFAEMSTVQSAFVIANRLQFSPQVSRSPMPNQILYYTSLHLTSISQHQ